MVAALERRSDRSAECASEVAEVARHLGEPAGIQHAVAKRVLAVRVEVRRDEHQLR